MTIKDINTNQHYSIANDQSAAWLESFYFNEQTLEKIKDIRIIRTTMIIENRPCYFVSEADYKKILDVVWKK